MTAERTLRIEDRLARGGLAVECLRLPAWLFGAASGCRARLYDRGWLPAFRVDAPVISVGNLTAGGTGKTPLVAWLVARLAERGWRPGILSRGYKGSRDGANDEARMLERLAKGVPHVQKPDRVAGASELLGLGVDVIVLDDGFQHRRLVRDLDLVLVDATRPWGLGPDPSGKMVRAMLPRGLLREDPRALARADAIVLTRVDGVDSARLAELEQELSRHAPGRPLLRSSHVPVSLRTGGDEDLGVETLDGLEVDLLSGIGNPGAFEATVTRLGARVVEHRAFPDHHPYTPSDLAGLGSRPLVTTAKDGVKLEGLEPCPWVLDVALSIQQGEDALEALLDGLPEGSSRRERRALHEGLHG